MEYFGNCPKCRHHTIVKSVKAIKSATARLPQRIAYCINCETTARITIIGTVEKSESTTTVVNPEFATNNTLRIKLWA
jgi:transcription elongation factor Elf1